jgi:hypothetical protein
MPEDTPTDREHRITSDPDTIEEWAKDHDVVPVREPSGSRHESDLDLEPDDRADEDRRVDWETFHDEAERHDLALARTGEGPGGYDIIQRGEAAERAALDTEEVEDALLEGETVTTEIAETRVIETEVTETETVESEVVDRETVDSAVIDRELVDREIREGELMDDERMNLEVLDTFSETREEVEQLTVESRVTDAEIVESDTVTEDEVTAAVDVEGVQETVLQSDLIGGDVDPTRVVEADLVDSEVEGDTITTELYEQRVTEEEVVERKDAVIDVDEADVLSTYSVTSQTIDRDIVDEGAMATGDYDLDATGTTAGPTRGETETGRPTEGAEMGESPVPTGDETGATVVDTQGREIGMVTDVEGDTMYVDPDASVTEKVMATLDWGDHDDDDYPVPPEIVSDIDRDDDQVVLSVERDEEFHDEHT